MTSAPRRITPPSHLSKEAKRPRSFWLLVPKPEPAMDSPSSPSPSPPLLGDLTGWGVRRKVRYTGVPAPAPAPAPVPSPSPSSSSSPKPLRGARARWSDARFAAAETKLVEIMRSMSATAASPVGRLPLRDEARKHIGDTGLLDHLLKHAVGKLVAGGPDRLRRRHNPNGAMEYWLEPGELAQVRREAGVSDPFWVPPPGWKVGDAAAVCPCGEDCEKEASELGAEVASMRRHYQSLLQWKNTVDMEMVTMSSNLLAMQQELLSMRDEKRKRGKYAGGCHSNALHKT